MRIVIRAALLLITVFVLQGCGNFSSSRSNPEPWLNVGEVDETNMNAVYRTIPKTPPKNLADSDQNLEQKGGFFSSWV